MTRAEMIAAVRRAAQTAKTNAEYDEGIEEDSTDMRQHEAALRAALATLEAARWVKIEDCPAEWKDGRPVVLYGRCRPNNVVNPYSPDQNIGWWDAESGQWLLRQRDELIDPIYIRLMPAPPEVTP